MSTVSCVTALAAATDADRFGGKAAQLAAARRAGLPVPDGWALGWPQVEALVRRGSQAAEVEGALRDAVGSCGPVAARSSAVGEDSRDASFAGAHLSVLGLVGGDAVVDAVRRVHASSGDPGALAYRDTLALDGALRMGVVVQQMVDADVAGVLFTRNPLTGAHELVIEASWGLGEAVVSGLVTPDHVRATRDGRVLQLVPGDKDLAIRLTPAGSTQETPVPPDLVESACLGPGHVSALAALVHACDEVYGDTDHDVEFAFAGGDLYLLQRRPITHG
ncbi:MAG: PEP/pyruvate-binding domain-containing protein [Actinomycetales bacterium]